MFPETQKKSGHGPANSPPALPIHLDFKIQVPTEYMKIPLSAFWCILPSKFVEKYEMAPGIPPQMGGCGMKRSYMKIQDGICLKWEADF